MQTLLGAPRGSRLGLSVTSSAREGECEIKPNLKCFDNLGTNLRVKLNMKITHPSSKKKHFWQKGSLFYY